jgi:aldose 1-epimerase
MTNHSYFNLAGHNRPELAMEQVLTIPSESYTATDWMGFPTGELKSVEGTPMDFRTPKAIKQDIRGFFKGYDHNFVVNADPCAVLHDPHSGRTMAVSTDCPGLQLYTGGVRGPGKGGASYGKHCAVCLESQYFPDAVNHPQWPQPFFTHYKSQTTYRFTW